MRYIEEVQNIFYHAAGSRGSHMLTDRRRELSYAAALMKQVF